MRRHLYLSELAETGTTTKRGRLTPRNQPGQNEPIPSILELPVRILATAVEIVANVLRAARNVLLEVEMGLRKLAAESQIGSKTEISRKRQRQPLATHRRRAEPVSGSARKARLAVTVAPVTRAMPERKTAA